MRSIVHITDRFVGVHYCARCVCSLTFFVVQAEYFPTVPKIKYDPKAPASNQLVFHHYNASEVVMGKTMEDWCRFAVCYWHTFCGTGSDPFGKATIKRPFDDGTDSLENAKTKLKAAFEFFTYVGWTFSVRLWLTVSFCLFLSVVCELFIICVLDIP